MSLKSFTVTTYNLFLPVLPPIRIYGQFERAKRVGEAVAQLKTDVIVFNELVPGQLLEEVTQQMMKLGFHYRNEQTLKTTFSMNGGIWVFSKYPIVKEDAEVFYDCLSSDCFISKGVIYCALALSPKFKVHLVASHLQAWEGKTYDEVRTKQLHRIGEFIRRQKIPRKEMLLLAGDLNMNLKTLRTKEIMPKLQWRLPPLHKDSFPFSWDPQSNRLVGLDSMSAYSSEKYPQGCVNTFWDKGYCACCPSEFFDVILYEAGHRSPRKITLKAVPVKVKPFTMSFALNTSDTCEDVSDHYPVTAHITL